jgi:chromate transport protein ChrA
VGAHLSAAGAPPPPPPPQVGVALVASAAKNLCIKVCPDTVGAILCAAAAVASLYKPAPWMFPSLVGLGGLVTVVVRRKQQFKVEVGPRPARGERGERAPGAG